VCGPVIVFAAAVADRSQINEVRGHCGVRTPVTWKQILVTERPLEIFIFQQINLYLSAGMCWRTTPSRSKPRPVPFAASRLSRVKIRVSVRLGFWLLLDYSNHTTATFFVDSPQLEKLQAAYYVKTNEAWGQGRVVHGFKCPWVQIMGWVGSGCVEIF